MGYEDWENPRRVEGREIANRRLSMLLEDMKRKKKLNPCQYCGESETVKGQQIKLSPGPCVCGDIHSACKKCQLSLNRTLGEFPDYKVVLRRCPPTK